MDAPDTGEATRGRRTWVAVLIAFVLVVGGFAMVNRVVYEAIPPTLLPPMEPVDGVGSLSAASCAGCHAEIAAEWATSLHARATSDPLYQADLAHQGAPYFCDHCHAPLMEQREQIVSGLWLPWPELVPRAAPNPRYRPGLHAEGVTCVACHQRAGAMVGPHQTSVAPHPVQVSTELGEAEACAGCHVLDVSLVGDLRRPLGDTLAEWKAYRALGGEKRCVDCHMPLVGERPIAREGPPRPSRSHALLGAFDEDFVRAGLGVEQLTLAGTLARGVDGSLALVNRSGHRIPTAEPHRRVDVVLEITGADHEVLQATRYVVQRRVNLETLTEAPGDDTTLGPLEQRSIQLQIPGPLPRGARHGVLKVDFILWDADHPLAKASQIPPLKLRHRIVERRLSLPAQ